MDLFNRERRSKVLGGEDLPKASSAPSSRKEKLMENQANTKGSLLDIMPAKRRGGADKSAPAASSSAPVRPGEGTFISGDTVIEGKITAQGELSIDGTFKGDIVSNNVVIVGNAGKIEGTVEAKSLVLSGKVVGNLKIQDRLELQSTGELVGDLQTQPGALIIEKGARLEGRCSMGMSEKKGKPAPSGKPEEPKQAAQEAGKNS